jgi:presequence protease
MEIHQNSENSGNWQVSGYKLIEKRFVREANAEVYYYEHIKSGAHLLKIANGDQNKTFGIGFKTEPDSDCGTPHIIEHSVLNGSKNFPVKSPFDEMGKTSLKTFLNAFTASEWTFYPVASMNQKDYFNLMTVYLDAVFFPLIMEDERIFKQEGWHYELEDKNSPIVYKGVVYNEMKGAFSSPESELHFQINKNLFPDNGYGKESGGHPLSIPDLTYSAFLAYYAKNYHPANSCLFLYGDADMEAEMELINKQYLSFFNKIEVNNKIKVQEPFGTFKHVSAPYSVLEGTPVEDQAFLALNWVIGFNTDKKLTWALDILADVLVNQESAPVRLALQQAGIGKEISAYRNPLQQNVFAIVVQNANSEDAQKFREIVFNVLQEAAAKGLDLNAVDAYLNRAEFSLREGNDSQKGLSRMLESFQDWIFTGNPFVGMEWEKQLETIKNAIGENYLEKTITEGLIVNQFGLLLVLEPKPGLEKEISDKTEAKLKAYKDSLSEEQLEQLVMETNGLIEYQQRDDIPEALATLPKLNRGDINPNSDWFQVNEKEIDGTKILHFPNFTNGVVYANLFFDARVLPFEMLPYASLLTNLLGKMDTENYTYGELEKELSKNTGSFFAYFNTFKEHFDDSMLLPKFAVVSKAMPDKTGKMFDLAHEVLFQTKFNDKGRLKTMLTRLQSGLESNLKNNGIYYATLRASSYYSNMGLFNELISGLDFYFFINDLVANFDKKSAEIVENLSQVAALLFTKENLILGSSCEKNDYEGFLKSFQPFEASLPKTKNQKHEWKFEPVIKNEGLLASSKVQYVVKGYNFRKLGYDWNGKMQVLNKILSNDYLQNKIRVIGGAYGGWSGIMNDGTFYFASYRDPNLKETLDNYDGAVDFIENFKASDEEMLGFIIGTLSGIDRPLTASQKAEVAYRRYFEKMTPEKLQDERENILRATSNDISQMAKMIADVLKQDCYCVYGNKEKLESNKTLFGKLINIEQK